MNEAPTLDPHKITLPTGMRIAGSLPPFSLGICSHQPERVKEAVFHWQRGLSDLQKEVPTLVVNPPSMAVGYNQILEKCATEYLILSHHDAGPFPLPNYLCGKRLLERMNGVDLLGFAGASRVIGPRWFDSIAHSFGGVCNFPADPPGKTATPEEAMMRAVGFRVCNTSVWGRPARRVFNIRTMDGYCLVVNVASARKIMFDESLNPGGFHGYDQDFCMACYAAGLKTAVCCDIYISHNSTGSYFQEKWAEHIQPFLKKWKGRFDGVITGVGKSAVGYGSGDARLVLLTLQEEEQLMQEDVVAP